MGLDWSPTVLILVRQGCPAHGLLSVAFEIGGVGSLVAETGTEIVKRIQIHSCVQIRGDAVGGYQVDVDGRKRDANVNDTDEENGWDIGAEPLIDSDEEWHTQIDVDVDV